AMRAQLLQRIREVINGVVWTWPRTVPAAIVRGEEIGLEGLLGHGNAEAEGLEAAVVGRPAAVRIEPEFRVGQVTPFRRTQCCSDSARLFVATIEEDDVTVRFEALGHQLHRGHGRGDVAILHVRRTPAEEVAAFLTE